MAFNKFWGWAPADDADAAAVTPSLADRLTAAMATNNANSNLQSLTDAVGVLGTRMEGNDLAKQFQLLLTAFSDLRTAVVQNNANEKLGELRCELEQHRQATADKLEAIAQVLNTRQSPPPPPDYEGGSGSQHKGRK
jgi:hypothetical protein